jgi:hypothetical protein
MATARALTTMGASIIFAGAAAAQSASDVEIKRAIGEVAGELQICSDYFLVGSSCLSAQEPSLARTYREMSDKVADLAIKSGRAIGVSDEAYAAMAQLETETMMKSMRGNCTNIAVLLQRYSKFCQRLSQDADPRVKEWIVCARAKQRTCNGPGLP